MIKYFLMLLITLCSMNVSAEPLFVYETEKIEGDINISVEVYDPDNVKGNEVLDFYKEYVPGNYITFFRFNNFPKNKEIVLWMAKHKKNDKFEEDTLEERCKFRILDDNSIKIADVICPPNLWFGSQGFLPGERINCKFVSTDKSFEYSTYFMPHPIYIVGENRKIAMHAELMSWIPISFYHFTLTGFEEGEEVCFASKSSDELISSTVNFSEDQARLYTGDVVGLKGGHSALVFSTKTDEMRFYLPWGSSFSDYLFKCYYDPNVKPE